MIKLFIYFWVTLIGCLLTNKLPNIVTMTLYVAEMHAQKFRVGKSSTLYLNRDAKPATVFPGHCFPPSLFLNPNSLSLSVCLSPKIQFDFWAPFTVPHTFSTFSFLYFLEKNFSLLPKPLLPPPLLSLSLSHNGFNLNWNSLIDAHFSLCLLFYLVLITLHSTLPHHHHTTAHFSNTPLSLSFSLSLLGFSFSFSQWPFEFFRYVLLSLSLHVFFCCCFDSVLKFSCDFGISFPCFREFAEYSRSVLRVKALTLNALARDSRFLL